MTVLDYVVRSLQSGLGGLASYLAAHVLLCLLPAFFIAGGLTALVPKESVMRFLGRRARKYVAYPAAATAGSLLTVCSCTILPLFAGIYAKGAGIGPAVTFLFFAPAANILALAYTGVAIGADLALARLILSLLFAIGIGLIMALVFRRDDAARAEASDDGFAGEGGLRKGAAFVLVLMVLLLLAGTLKLSFLTGSWAEFSLPLQGVEQFQATLNRLVPFDAAKGEEGVSVQGVLLIGLLIVIAAFAVRGLGKAPEKLGGLTWTALGLIGATLAVASLRIVPTTEGLSVSLTGRTIGVIVFGLGLLVVARRHLRTLEVQQWFWETWRFVRQIFPLLVVGVFAVGVIRVFIQPEWIRAVAGSNTLLGNLVGVLFGVFMYFPTLVEVPIAKMFLSLGMHPGPLIAYLMADPELSLQSVIILIGLIGRAKAFTYVGLVAVFSTVSGLIYGAWKDGTSVGLLAVYVGVFLLFLGGALYLLGRNRATLGRSVNS